jgi:hypothetical protein
VKFFRYCPIHEHEVGQCSGECLAARAAFRRSAQALRNYWMCRKLGMRPMKIPEYIARYARRKYAA